LKADAEHLRKGFLGQKLPTEMGPETSFPKAPCPPKGELRTISLFTFEKVERSKTNRIALLKVTNV
jgi:hypothetical protein